MSKRDRVRRHSQTGCGACRECVDYGRMRAAELYIAGDIVLARAMESAANAAEENMRRAHITQIIKRLMVPSAIVNVRMAALLGGF